MRNRDSVLILFTLREKEILILIIDGLSNEEIAKRLNISVGTVRNYIHNIFVKTGFRNRIELINDMIKKK